MRDFKRLTKDPPSGISAAPVGNDIMTWQAVIFGCVYAALFAAKRASSVELFSSRVPLTQPPSEPTPLLLVWCTTSLSSRWRTTSLRGSALQGCRVPEPRVPLTHVPSPHTHFPLLPHSFTRRLAPNTATASLACATGLTKQHGKEERSISPSTLPTSTLSPRPSSSSSPNFSTRMVRAGGGGKTQARGEPEGEVKGEKVRAVVSAHTYNVNAVSPRHPTPPTLPYPALPCLQRPPAHTRTQYTPTGTFAWTSSSRRGVLSTTFLPSSPPFSLSSMTPIRTRPPTTRPQRCTRRTAASTTSVCVRQLRGAGTGWRRQM